jgi:hypothetical protein
VFFYHMIAPHWGDSLFLEVVPMKSSKKHPGSKMSPPAWHAGFEAMLPVINGFAAYAFRHLREEARREAVQAVVCNCCNAYVGLVRKGKVDRAFPAALARFAIVQVLTGRRLGGHLNCRDVSSEYCHKLKGIQLERLDRFDAEEEQWQEVVVEDRRSGPAEVAATRIDFAAWLRLLPSRLRKIARFLANGETTAAAAKQFELSPGRISQIRQELFLAWQRFQGEEPALAAA